MTSGPMNPGPNDPGPVTAGPVKPGPVNPGPVEAAPLKSVEEHLAECLAAAHPLSAVGVAPVDAAGRVLAEDVATGILLPVFDNSAMDGYAVLLADVAGAAADRPVSLPVAGDVPAGSREVPPLRPGTAVRVMTGAPVPDGTQAVVPVEWTDAGTGTVRIDRAPGPGQYLRPAGEDARPGDVLLRAGIRLEPRHIAVIAAVGRDRVRVHPRPRVVVLSTGSELVAPGESLGPGQIYDANGPALTAAATELGADAHYRGILPDDPALVRAAFADLDGATDLVLTSGGVSAGAYDVVKEVLSGTGTVRFDRVALQPGMPQGFGTLGPAGTPLFALPGNPVSALVSFELFVRPMLLTLAGETDLHRRTRTVRLAAGWTSPRGRRQYARVRFAPVTGDVPGDRDRPGAGDGNRDGNGDGPLLAHPVGGLSSHRVAGLAAADALVIVPEEVTEVRAGDLLPALPLGPVRP
jgi:molybdopterin molybdotransferase